ncbi:hypothetical protein HMPREF1544_10079 [Mucor circinelloides 1006PhL]|uniref:Homeobox domain-containing protein n=1 Tax=Mucor circinelloides f. circinelloides (strain 1006PhL) TaxID=1220926 RepID=S2IZJ0_MUCC1|nr:hypothetical protein HMPREF1544_10079 [Mucor circinelloides 1006PhL]
MSHRVFKPVILFHDHSYSTDPLGVTHRIHIPYGDPHYTPLIQQKKYKVGLMLQTNGRAWYDIIKSSRSKYRTPKPSYYKKRRYYYQTDFSSDAEEDEDDNHSTMTSSSSSCTTNSSGNSIASPIPTFKAPTKSTTTTTTAPAPATTITAANASTLIARKRRGNLPKTVTAVLKQWLIDHCRNPYPTEIEKTGLKDKTGLTLNQISNWFINARRRLLPQILASMHPNHTETNGMLHHHHHSQQHHQHTIAEEEDDDDDGVDDDEEEDDNDMIPMPQPQKRKKRNFLYSTNNQQAPPTTVVRKRRRYNKRSHTVLS